MSNKKLKIFVLPVVAWGHVNPICGVVYELCRMPDVECVIYGVEEYRQLMERTGATVRMYAHRGMAGLTAAIVDEKSRTKFFRDATKVTLESAHFIIPQLMQDVIDDEPDLIFFDAGFTVVRYFVGKLKLRGIKIKVAEFYPNFVYSPKMLKNNPDLFKWNIDNILLAVAVYFKTLKLSWDLNFPFYSPMNIKFDDKERIKIVAVFPDLHPDLDDYDVTYKFVGQCVAEEARQSENFDPEIKSILDKFPVKSLDDEKITNNEESRKLLVLMSLGTIFHGNERVYEHMIDDVNKYDERPGNRRFRSSQFQFIVSTGQSTLQSLNEKIALGKLSLPANVVLRAQVPQLEILKRADLFITHNGQNSTSESIKYGVPMVSIPIFGDQPVVSKRVCDDLLLGVRLDPLKIKPGDIGDAIDKVLSEPKYRKNVQEMAKISAEYNGRQAGARLLVDFINKKEETLALRVSKNAIKSNQVQPLSD